MLTTPSITAHALQRAALRWGIQEPAVAEWLILETIRLGDILPRDNGTVQFRHALPNGFTRIVICRGDCVLTVANSRSSAFIAAQKRKRGRGQA